MRFEIEGPPIAKARHRYSRRGKIIVTYDPQEKLKNRVKEIFTQQLHDAFNSHERGDAIEASEVMRSRSLTVHLMFFMPIPKSLSARKRGRLALMESHVIKPDLDNLVKFYLDAANGILWDDDKKISCLYAEKLYSEIPRTLITIRGYS